MKEYSVVGKSLPRLDSISKVSGEARYTVDMFLPGMLYGKILRSPYPHARILNIDISKANRLPGVKSMITGKDTLGVRYSYFTNPPQYEDELILAIDKVRHIGEAVAAVAAASEDIAEEALDVVEVEYEELPSVFNPEEAMKDGSPRIHENVGNNIAHQLHLDFGNIVDGFDRSEYIREDRFITNPLNHGFLEPHVSIAKFDLTGKLTVWTSTQIPFFLRKDLSKTLGLTEGMVRVIKPYVGGAHCGKLELLAHHFCSALLSKKTGRPVKIELSRDEIFQINRGAHPVIIDLKTGVKKEGILMAQQAKLIADGGAYLSAGLLLNVLAGAFIPLPYRLNNFKYDGYIVYTNNPVCATQRGMGLVQMRYAIDSQLDMIAKDLGIDPMDLMIKNAIQPMSTTITKTKVTSCGLIECIQKARDNSDWEKKRLNNRGIGIGCGFCSSGVKGTKVPNDTSAAFVKIHPDGTAILLVGAADLGQGSDTILSQILAEELGISLEDIRIVSADTEITPVDLGSLGSRVTFQAGNAVRAAASDAKKILLEVAAQKLNAKVEDLEIKHKQIFIRGLPDRMVSFVDAVRASEYSEKGEPIMGKGYYNPDSEIPDPETLEGNIALAYSFGTAIAEVNIDIETGKIEVSEIISAHDCGFPINPMAVEGQIEGQAILGLGQALYEERILDRGLMLNPSFLGYKIPTSLEMPIIKSILVETIDPNGPFGAKECGEGPQVSIVPAIVNAVHDAIGLRIKELPITPEKI